METWQPPPFEGGQAGRLEPAVPPALGAVKGFDFCAPPTWPDPPLGWLPGVTWLPDPSWPKAPEGWSFWQRRPSKARSLRAWLAWLIGSSAVVIAGSTFLPGAPWVPEWLAFVPFVSIFPLFGSTVVEKARL